MSTSYGAIPTLYRGIRFRSRLEARWACFFDLLGWPWVYEPFDLQGYIPDFVLLFHEPLLVEVKPALAVEELRAHTEKLDASGWEGEAIVVGARLFVDDAFSTSSIGLLGERAIGETLSPPDNDVRLWWELAACGWCGTHWGIAHGFGSYVCRVLGCYDGNPPCDHEDNNEQTLATLWNEASNRTQWRGRR